MSLTDFQSFNTHFKIALTVVEWVVKFDSLGSTFIPKIFADKDWENLFEMFAVPIEELIKEFYSNTWFTRAKLKCWVWGKDFIITQDYLAKILQMNRPLNVVTTPYDDRVGHFDLILETLGADLEVSVMGTSIGTTRFTPEIKTLALIMHSNLYPLTNMGRAKFFCDLINGASINICAHIFQTLGKTAAKLATRTCLPFCNLIMKILLLNGIHPPKDGTILPRQGLITLQSLKSGKFYSSTKKAKKSFSKTPKSESKTLSLATPIRQSSAAFGSSHQPKANASSPRTLEPQPSHPQPPSQSSIPQLDRMVAMMEGIHDCISRL